MEAPTIRDRILEQINRRLCSQSAEIREEGWRTLVRGLRVQGQDPSMVSDALTELLSVVAEPIGPGMRVLSAAEYHQLSRDEKNDVDNRYKECLDTAQKEFPYIFQVDVINVPTSPADMVLAERAASLPRLNADQQSLAKALGISESIYARTVLAKQYSEDRYRFYAEVCWRFLDEAGRSHSADVMGVVYDVAWGKFYCDVGGNDTVRRFVLNARIIWEPLEVGDKLGLDRAREAVRFAVEQALASAAEHVSSGVDR